MKNIVERSTLVLFILFFISCEKKNSEAVEENSVLEFTSLSISKDLNPSISENVILEATNGNFQASLYEQVSKDLILSFNTNAEKVLIGEKEQKSGVTKNDFSNELTYTLVGKRGEKKNIKVKINWREYTIPHIYLTTAGNAEITSKSTYLDANISIKGNDDFADFNAETQIRGRGNSTWNRPKKPYRLRLKSKQSIFGLKSARNWVLLANHIDPSLMCNAVAMKIGRDLNAPFTHDIIPVDVTINNQYRGSYVLTQHIEVDENRVNIGDDGYLLELDSYYDEDYKFRSKNYNLPVMIKHPDLSNNDQVLPIKQDFDEMESLIFNNSFPDNNYDDYIDISSFTKYILVYFLTGNEELNHPKSIYIHKKKNSKFTFGPIWDFDWAYGYENGLKHFANADRSLFWESRNALGTKFFSRLLEDPKVRKAFKDEWEAYKKNKFTPLLEFIDDYSLKIRKSKQDDVLVWGFGTSFDLEVNKLKTYLKERSNYLDSYVRNF